MTMAIDELGHQVNPNKRCEITMSSLSILLDIPSREDSIILSIMIYSKHDNVGESNGLLSQCICDTRAILTQILSIPIASKGVL